jgi:hypothetical protein
MRATVIVLLLVLAASAQSTKKAAPHKAAPAPAQMSHDFRVAGRRAVSAIVDLGRWCSPEAPMCGGENELLYKAVDAIKEADAQRDNAVDKSALELLENFKDAAKSAEDDRERAALNKSPFATTKLEPLVQCKAGACEAMYKTCKKEAEQAFETGLMPAKVECKSLRDSK